MSGRWLERIGIVGSGRAARALGAALARRGRPAALVWARDEERGRAATREARAGGFEGRLAAFLRESELVLLAVADAALEPLAAEIAEALSSGARDDDHGPRVVLHLAGARSSSVLDTLRERAVACGVFHPVVVLTGTESADALSGAIVTISGDPPAVAAAHELARLVDAVPADVDDASRTLLHAGAVMAAGHVVTLLHLAERLVREAELEPRLARQLVTSLAASAVRAHADGGLPGGITGPLPRGDLATVDGHLQELRARPTELEDARAAYESLLRAAARALTEAGIAAPNLLARVDALLAAGRDTRFAGDDSD